MLRSFFEYLGRNFPIENRFVFLGASAVFVAYVAYISIARRRKPGRPGNEL
ncbi:MAG: hypothetical protein U0800_02655 [Isosphaeraceae bacterium]